MRVLDLAEVRGDDNGFKPNAPSRGDAVFDERLEIDETLREKVPD